jgi:hypothetical protein
VFEPDRPQMTVWRMCIACWISKATDQHLEYVIMFFFFHGNNGYAKTSQSDVISKLPVFTMEFLVINETFLKPMLSV